MQNNEYCKALIMKWLCGSVLPAKSLHFYSKFLHHVLRYNKTKSELFQSMKQLAFV